MKQHWLILTIFVLLIFQSACKNLTPVTEVDATPSKQIIITQEETALPTQKTSQGTTKSNETIQIRTIKELSFPTQNVKDIKWSPSGKYFIVTTEKQTVLYETNTQKEVWSINPDTRAYYVSGVEFSPDEEDIFLYIRLAGFQKRDLLSGELVEKSSSNYNVGNCFPADAIGTARTSINDSLFISVTTEDAKQNSRWLSEIQVWDLSTLKCIDVFSNVEGNARSLSISDDGKFLALGIGLNTSISGNDIQENGQIFVWNLENAQQACLIENKGAFAHFKPGSSVLLVNDPNENRFIYWDVKTCEMVGELSGISTRYDFSFSSDGQLLAIWNNGISILDSISGATLKSIEDPVPNNVFPTNRLFSALAFNSDGQYLLYSVRREPFESLITIWKIER